MNRLAVSLLLALGLCVGLVSAQGKTDALVQAIQKKNYDKFIEELTKDNVDANQPDSKGRMPIVEAVRTKDIKFVDSVIQFGALAKTKDPATGTTPLHLAFQHNQPAIARLLLAYGADVNVADKSGKKAREYAPTAEIRQMITAFDDKGHMAFEDEPGAWLKQKEGKSSEEYWFNVKTGDSRWNMPPSCAWIRLDVFGQPHKYLNQITGQEVVQRPAALSWAKVTVNKDDLWYNWAINITQRETPAEMPEVLIKEAEKHANVRWYNDKTGQFSWEDPAYHTSWRVVPDEEAGRPFYFNVETGETTWESPDELVWKEQTSEDGKWFFNEKTGEASWEAPPHLAWAKHDFEL